MPCILSVDSNKLFRWDIFIFGILEIFPTEGGVFLSESVKLQASEIPRKLILESGPVNSGSRDLIVYGFEILKIPFHC